MIRSPRLLGWSMGTVLSVSILAAPAAADPGGYAYVPGQVIVKFKKDAPRSAVAQAKAALAADRVKTLGRTGAELRQLKSLDVESAVAAFRGHPAVEYIEPNYVVHAAGVPNDPFFPQLWAMRNTGQTGGTPGADIDAVDAWDVFTGSPDVLIGVIDSGVDYTHPDLAANVWTNPGEIAGNGIDDDGNGFVDDVHGWDFRNGDNDPMDDNGHGTHAAGTIAGVGNNGIGVTGVSWTAKVVALKFLDAQGSGTIAGAIDALDYATRLGVKLTNNSWGGGGYSQALRDAIDAADAAGILFVAIAGGGGNDIDLHPFYPASYTSPNIVAVEGTDENDVLGGYSGYGAATVDLAAPGSNILSTLPGNRYGYYSGTSMAAAHVSGALGLMFGAFPELGPHLAKARLLATVDPKPGLVGTCVSGGRLDLFLAVTAPDTVVGTVGALADVDPNSINVGGGGNWVTAYVELPEDVDPSLVVLGTVRLNGVVPADPDRSGLGDFNHNKIPDWSFKFDRAAVEAILPEGDAVPVTVTGEIRDTVYFVGTDRIRVHRPKVLQPDGGETVTSGDVYRVTWANPSGHPVDHATVLYSADGGDVWSLVADDVTGTGCDWRVPDEATSSGLIRVYLHDQQGVMGYDTSDGPFAVVPASVGVEESPPVLFRVRPGEPNPFSLSTRIGFDLPADGRVTAGVFDLSGRTVRTLADRPFPAGSHALVWDGRGERGERMPAGIYFCRVEASGRVRTVTLSLVSPVRR